MPSIDAYHRIMETFMSAAPISLVNGEDTVIVDNLLIVETNNQFNMGHDGQCLISIRLESNEGSTRFTTEFESMLYSNYMGPGYPVLNRSMVYLKSDSIMVPFHVSNCEVRMEEEPRTMYADWSNRTVPMPHERRTYLAIEGFIDTINDPIAIPAVRASDIAAIIEERYSRFDILDFED